MRSTPPTLEEIHIKDRQWQKDALLLWLAGVDVTCLVQRQPPDKAWSGVGVKSGGKGVIRFPAKRLLSLVHWYDKHNLPLPRFVIPAEDVRQAVNE